MAQATALEQQNRALREDQPALWEALSPTARQAIYPADIPFQAAQARSAEYNATIGQITDGRGRVLQLPAVERMLSGLGEDQRNRALLYSPIGGLDELREAWRERERRLSSRAPGRLPVTSLPLVTAGLTHALALAADLFGGAGRAVLIPDPCWGNYNQVFGLRTGSRMLRYPFYEGTTYRADGVLAGAAGLAEEEPVTVVLNFPSNPGGYMPNAEERATLVDALLELCSTRSVVAICDDAYAGLVFGEVPPESIFWDLIGRHERLIPVRGSGATKEFLLFGARVGFLTLPYATESPAGAALDDKLRCLLRAGVGSPVALSQQLLLGALCSGDVEEQIADHVATLRGRFERMRSALLRAQERGAPFRLMPANSGAFQLLRLEDGLAADTVRLRLIEEQSTGVVSIGDRYLRLAFCSVDLERIEPLIDRVVAGLSGGP